MSQNAIKCPKCGQAIKVPQTIDYNHQMVIKFRDRVQAINEAACTIAMLCGELDAMADAFLPHKAS